MRRLGIHTSIAGGLHLSLGRAKGLGCTTMQIFSHNPRGWDRRRIGEDEINEFKRSSDAFDIKPVFIHSSYLINLASPHDDVRRRSVNLLAYEMKLARSLGIEYIVLHPGKAAGQDIKTAINKASKALSAAFEKAEGSTGILLENTAGQKGDISYTIPLISEIIEKTIFGCVRGICLDTCHAYAAGYEVAGIKGLERLEKEIKKYLSPLGVELIHLNDSKRELSSGIDRHQHIGKGHIGLKGFKEFLSYPFFKGIPLILETPVDVEGDDRRNLERVRKILKTVEFVQKYC